MKYEKGFQKKEPNPIFSLANLPRIPSHAPVQVAITGLALALSVGGFLAVAVLQGHVDSLNANYQGDLKNDYAPCARKPLPVCDGDTQDVCRAECCPEGYMCVRDPTVGMYCQDVLVACGRFDFCLDTADIAGTCEREHCKRRKVMTNMSFIVFVLAAVGVLLDLIDMILCFLLADNVLIKTLANFVSCLVKLLAFAGVLGVGTEGFLSDMDEAACFNANGALIVDEAQQMFLLGVLALFFSSGFTLCLVPISALHGGRLQDKPMYQMKSMEITA